MSEYKADLSSGIGGTSGSKAGILDDPLSYIGAPIQGAALIPARIGFGVANTGVDVLNTANRMLGYPADYQLDIGEDFWDAYGQLGFDAEGVGAGARAVTEIGAFAVTIKASMAKMATTKAFGKMMQSSKKWDQFKAAAIADVGATALLTSGNDKSILSFIPEESRPEVFKWFIDREDDTEIESRVKNIIEGLALGGTLELSAAAIGRAFRSLKATAHTVVDTEKVDDILKIADNTLGSGDGTLVDDFINNETVVGSTTRRKTKRYQPEQPQTAVESIPLREIDTPKPTVDEEAVRIASGLPSEASKIFRRIADDVNTPKADREAAKAWLKGADTRPYMRLNGENSGAASIYGGLETNLMLQIKSNIDKRPKRSWEEAYVDSQLALRSGTLGLKVNNLALEGAYDEEGLIHHLAMSTVLGYDVEEIIVASQVFRSKNANKLQELARTIAKEGDDILNSKHMDEFIAVWERIDTLDAGMQSTIGSAARIMNFQQVNPNDAVKSLNMEASKTRQARLNRKGKVKPTKEEESPLAYFKKSLGAKDKEAGKRFIQKVASAPSLNSKDIKKIVKGHDIMDVFEAFYLGSLLSGLKTLAGGVGMGGATSTAWKLLVMPVVEGAVNRARLIGGGPDSGARSIQSVYNAASIMDTTFKAARHMFSRGDDKKLVDIIHTGFTEAREGADMALGTMTKAEWKKELKHMSKVFRDNKAYKRATIMDIARTILAPVVSIQNMGTRGIVNIDNFYKGLNNEATMAMEARRWWHREGGREMFGSVDTQEQFLEEFVDLQKGYIKAQKLPADSRKDALEKLWDGRTDTAREAIVQSVERARTIGAEATLQQDASGTLTGGVLAQIKKKASTNPVTRFGSTSIFPFTKTPINYVSEIMEHTPLAITTKRFWDKMTSGNPEEQIDAASRVVAGSLLMSAIGYGVAAGTISGTIRPEERERAKALGIKPHSIFKDGVWYNYEKLGPIAALLSAVADSQRLIDTDPDAIPAFLGGQALAIASENSHLATFGELIEIIKDPNHVKAGTNFAFNKVHQTITPLYGAQASLRDIISIAHTIDPLGVVPDVNYKYRSTVDREVGGIYQEMQASMANALKNNTAFLVGSNMVGAGLFEKDVDVVGNDIRSSSETLSGKFLHLLGIGNLDQNRSPHVLELARFGFLPSNTNSNAIFGLKMKSNQFKDAMKSMYHGNTDAGAGLDALVTSPGYLAANDGQRKEWLRRAMDVYMDYVKNSTYITSSEMQQEKYVKDLFDITVDIQHTPLDFDDPEYIKSVRDAPKLRRSDNPVNIKRFKEELNLE